MACPDFEVPQSVSVQCGRCGQIETLRHGSSCLETFESTGTIQLHCSTCKSLTAFTTPQVAGTATGLDPNLLVTAQEIFTDAAATPALTRSKRLRICPRNMKACLRHQQKDDVAEVLDYCRTGVHIASHRQYELGTELEIAIDYTPGGTNIFQRARIVSIYGQPGEGAAGEYELAY